jgi:hypothetical protein
MEGNVILSLGLVHFYSIYDYPVKGIIRIIISMNTYKFEHVAYVLVQVKYRQMLFARGSLLCNINRDTCQRTDDWPTVSLRDDSFLPNVVLDYIKSA